LIEELRKERDVAAREAEAALAAEIAEEAAAVGGGGDEAIDPFAR
jgi:hypothetical protein